MLTFLSTTGQSLLFSCPAVFAGCELPQHARNQICVYHHSGHQRFWNLRGDITTLDVPENLFQKPEGVSENLIQSSLYSSHFWEIFVLIGLSYSSWLTLGLLDKDGSCSPSLGARNVVAFPFTQSHAHWCRSSSPSSLPHGNVFLKRFFPLYVTLPKSELP
jgi:hypothetical protein